VDLVPEAEGEEAVRRILAFVAGIVAALIGIYAYLSR